MGASRAETASFRPARNVDVRRLRGESNEGGGKERNGGQQRPGGRGRPGAGHGVHSAGSIRWICTGRCSNSCIASTAVRARSGMQGVIGRTVSTVIATLRCGGVDEALSYKTNRSATAVAVGGMPGERPYRRRTASSGTSWPPVVTRSAAFGAESPAKARQTWYGSTWRPTSAADRILRSASLLASVVSIRNERPSSMPPVRLPIRATLFPAAGRGRSCRGR